MYYVPLSCRDGALHWCGCRACVSLGLWLLRSAIVKSPSFLPLPLTIEKCAGMRDWSAFIIVPLGNERFILLGLLLTEVIELLLDLLLCVLASLTLLLPILLGLLGIVLLIQHIEVSRPSRFDLSTIGFVQSKPGDNLSICAIRTGQWQDLLLDSPLGLEPLGHSLKILLIRTKLIPSSHWLKDKSYKNLNLTGFKYYLNSRFG